MVNCCNNRTKCFIVMLAMIFPMALKAELADSIRTYNPNGYYIGIEGGSAMGFCTFSSVGHDKTRFGGTVGVYGGYRFNAVLSAELSVKFGKITMSARDCCAEQGYWFGADGEMYKASVLDMDSWNYSDLKSCVTVGLYGARMNVNLLGLFRKTDRSRWAVAVSPHVYAVSTKTNIRTIAGGADAKEYPVAWHFGYGADLQIGYQLSSRLHLGLYSGLTCLTGSRMDGMPKHLHKHNFVLENGIRLGLNLGRKQKSQKIEAVSAVQPIIPQEELERVENSNPNPKDTVINKVEAEVVVKHAEDERLIFPNVYFAFNQISIRQSEQPKLNVILKQLKENPDVKISVTGWCDTKGSQAVNKRVSLLRAEAVKAWLIRHGIDRERIRTVGNGIDYDAQDAAEARRVVTEENNVNQ